MVVRTQQGYSASTLKYVLDQKSFLFNFQRQS